MAKLINKRDALHILASKTTPEMKKKIKDVLRYHYQKLVEKNPGTIIKPIKEENAVRSYYQAIIDEAFKKSSHELERGKTSYIRQSTLRKAVEKIQNTNYYSTDQERYVKNLLKGYEELGMSTKELREKLGVSQLRKDYFEYIKMDENGNELIRYEDQIIFINFVRNEKGDTIDVIVDVKPIYGPFPKGKKQRRYAI